MQKQISLELNDETEETNQNHVFIFKQNKIKTKKCNFGMDLDLQGDKKKTN